MKTCLILFLLAIMLLAAGAADAYRVINIPTADLLDAGEIKVEWMGRDLKPGSAKTYRLDVGLKDRVELQVAHHVLPDEKDEPEFGAEVLAVPETTLIPGLAVGVLDITNRGRTGPSYYAVASKRIPFIEALPIPVKHIRVHAGVGTNFFEGIFFGGSLRLPLGLGLEAEHDTHGINYAASWNFGSLAKVRVMSINGDRAFSVILSPTF